MVLALRFSMVLALIHMRLGERECDRCWSRILKGRRLVLARQAWECPGSSCRTAPARPTIGSPAGRQVPPDARPLGELLHTVGT